MKHNITISNHALLMYIARGYGVDLDVIREEILTPIVVAQILSAKGNHARIRLSNGVVAAVNMNQIVTVLPGTTRTAKEAAKDRLNRKERNQRKRKRYYTATGV